ncbi:MAG TPA: nucleoside-diphosphate sugar epimerase/dehydratase [Methylophilus sp.]|nr:nucleoside-diphosphate sugar epimerase/dehydratase [Methylophilus sp.]HQQ33347.1 nucleoside-diphosphate sugar epimerase/dehydratase [Methylophilus sp.]
MKKTITNPKTILAIFHDVLASIVAWVASFLLRFNFDMPAGFVRDMLMVLPWVVILQSVVFMFFGLYQGVWRFASLPDLKRILKAVMFSAIAVASVLFMLKPYGVIPRSVLILNPVLLLLIMGGSRLAYRAWKEHKLYGLTQLLGNPVLVLGAGDAGITLVKDLSRSSQWRVVGLLDNDASLVGRELLGVKVLGKISQLAQIVKSTEVDHVIIAMPAANHQLRKDAVDLANSLNLEVLTVPAIEDLISGRFSISQIRKVEVEDLLGRDVVSLDVSGLTHAIEHKAVLVSGAGGSIGSELCNQILKFKPALLVCLDISEYALYQLEQNLTELAKDVQKLFLVRDVRNSAGVVEVLSAYKPSIVFHAAAYKHVPMMENYNVFSALENNVLGTYTIAEASKQAGVEQFVLISTDKAVNPTNVMGASKRMAEMICQGLQGSNGTRFVIVRFGNVLGSSGSVIPKFREQIAKGGPVTVTHPEITRYFMSIPEAAQLVMQAGLMGQGGEIFVLDMGEPVKIAELAKNMIGLSGFDTEQIEIVYTGLRPGEKLYEELLADDEHTLPTSHPKLRIAQARKTDIIWVKDFLVWLDSIRFESELEIKRQIVNWVSEYQAQFDSSQDSNERLVHNAKNEFVH